MARNFSLTLGPISGEYDSRVLAIYAAGGDRLAGEGARVFGATGLDFARLAKSVGFEGRQGQTIDLLAPGIDGLDRLLILGMAGEGDAPAATVWASRGGSLAGRLAALGVQRADVIVDEPGATPELLAEMAAGLALRHYRFDKYRSGREGASPASLAITLRTGLGEAMRPALEARMAVAEGTMLARGLVNEPPNLLGPSEFARAAQALAELGVRVEVLNEDDMAGLGMNALLAVGGGSARPPRLVVLEWSGGPKGEPPLALVGKGVVFDTGGISIKTASGMEDMKGDMAGAAAILGLFHALATRKARVNAVGVLGVVENMPDGRSYRPGDIIRTMSGKTVEVVNTDAEGRLVLADAMWFAQERFRPSLLIDLATLTGAVISALGHAMAGVFSNSEALVADLHAAGREAGEPLWHMPMAPFFESAIESRFADIKNSGGRKGGASAAAHFLQHFVKDVPWAHLDIAGMAFGTPSSETSDSWATGFGVALLDRYIRDRHERR